MKHKLKIEETAQYIHDITVEYDGADFAKLSAEAESLSGCLMDYVDCLKRNGAKILDVDEADYNSPHFCQIGRVTEEADDD